MRCKKKKNCYCFYIEHLNRRRLKSLRISVTGTYVLNVLWLLLWGIFLAEGGGIVPVAPLFTSIHLVFLASLGIAKIFRTFILLVVYSIIRPSWYHVMLAGGLEPYETQSMLLGSPERNGCSTPVMATFNGFTVNYYYYYYQTYCYYKNNNLKKTKTRSSVADPYLPSE